MQDEEQQRPLDERHVKSLDFIHGIFPTVAQIFFLEAVSADKEEQWHVEHIDESRPLLENGAESGMAYHHQYDGDSLGYGNSIFAHDNSLISDDKSSLHSVHVSPLCNYSKLLFSHYLALSLYFQQLLF